MVLSVNLRCKVKVAAATDDSMRSPECKPAQMQVGEADALHWDWGCRSRLWRA
jgi:hypothetical protein